MRRALIPLLFLAALALIAAVVLWRTWRPSGDPEEAGRLTVAETLGGEAQEGYLRAFDPRPLRFPQDHGPHPGYRTEWWYFTGNLEGEGGRHFGYQLTVFRIALAPKVPERPSAWGARDIYMAHFALTDVDGKRFHDFERFSRAALDLAGAKGDPFRVWLEDWSIAAEGEGTFPLRLRAAEGDVSVDLRLEGGKPVVLQGEEGLSRKSGDPGNASYYYSLTRMPTAGTVRVGGESFPVRGFSWLDREWSTSALGKGDVGWDWFALQLSDRREIMFYRLRRKDGSASPWSAGTLVEADGRVRRLPVNAVEIREIARWTSPDGRASYPSRWNFRVPSAGISLEIEPWLADQELQVTVRYWEGAVRISGESGGKRVTGNGYVEMTGYGRTE